MSSLKTRSPTLFLLRDDGRLSTRPHPSERTRAQHATAASLRRRPAEDAHVGCWRMGRRGMSHRPGPYANSASSVGKRGHRRRRSRGPGPPPPLGAATQGDHRGAIPPAPSPPARIGRPPGPSAPSMRRARRRPWPRPEGVVAFPQHFAMELRRHPPIRGHEAPAKSIAAALARESQVIFEARPDHEQQFDKQVCLPFPQGQTHLHERGAPRD